jgi:hypothetical protein
MMEAPDDSFRAIDAKALDCALTNVRSEGAVDGGLTHDGQMLGAREFIAPVQIRDAQSADIRADIYCVG